MANRGQAAKNFKRISRLLAQPSVCGTRGWNFASVALQTGPVYSRSQQMYWYLAELKSPVNALINALAVASMPTWEPGNLMSRWRNNLIVTMLFVALAGCGGSKITLNDPTIPEPLIDKLPITVVARYPDVFDSFVHEEQVIGKEKWVIDLGQSNRLLFTQLFGSMFTDFSVVEQETDVRDLPVDALIEPTIDAFEFSVPNQSQTDEFAVWIRYRIKIFDDEGVQIANWPIAAYGKSQTSTFGGDAALRRAAVLAMRDAAALIIMQMDKATGISKLSAARVPEELPPPSTVPVNENPNLQFTAAKDTANDSGI